MKWKHIAGISLVEALWASFILIVFLIGLATFVSMAFKTNDLSKEYVLANKIANSVMEEWYSVAFDKITPSTPPSPAPSYPQALIDTSTYQFPHQKIEINNQVYPRRIIQDQRAYRVDIIVYQGKYSRIASHREPRPKSFFTGLIDLTSWLVRPVQAAGCSISAPSEGWAYEELMFSGQHTGTSGNVSYLWKLGDNTTQTGSEVKHSYQLTRPYGVTLEIIKGNKTVATCQHQINILPNTIEIELDPANGEGYVNHTAFTFSATNCSACDTNTSYRWNFGVNEGQEEIGKDVTHVFRTPGTKTVTVTAHAPGAPSAQVSLEVLPSTVEIVASPMSGTVQQQFSFSVKDCQNCGASPTYLWNFGDYITETGEQVSHTYGQPGNYTVTLSVTGGSNPSGMLPITIFSDQSALIDIQPSNTGVAGSLNDSDTTLFRFNAKSLGYVQAKALTYTYELGDQASIVAVSPENSQVNGSTVVLTDDNPEDNEYPFVDVKYQVGGSHELKLTVTDGTTSSQVTQNVHVESRLSIEASKTTLQVGESLTLTAQGQGLGDLPVFYWDFGDTNQCEDMYEPSITHTYMQEGVYTVSLKAIGGSQPSATKVITVNGDTLPVAQEDMKKILIKVAPWNNKPPQNYLSTVILLKANNGEE